MTNRFGIRLSGKEYLVVKSVLDRLVALVCFPVLLPILLLIGAVIKVVSPGPVLYVSPRIGQFGRIFNLYKFRTMYVGADKEREGSITVRGDRRITPFGSFLRKYKIDELPSIINVLMGDLSFVGPRPDVPGYADKLEGDNRRVLLLKPGITGPATLKYAHEEKILAGVEDPVKYNDEVIFPDKVRINLNYLNNISLVLDIKLIGKTVLKMIWRKKKITTD